MTQEHAPRRPLMVANWKMHHGAAACASYLEAFLGEVGPVTEVDVAIAPPYTSLGVVAERLRGSRVGLAAQNVHWAEQGAFTGEISAAMLVEAGCRYAIVGHSERRQLFGETDATVHDRLQAALAAGLVPILCVGETDAQRDAGDTETVVDRQLDRALDGVAIEQGDRLVIAYEPVWAIGTGRTATPEQAGEVHRHVRDRLAARFAAPVAAGIRVLYGGSVKPGNVDELMRVEAIDGALVGGASLKPDIFARIVRFEP